MDGSTNQDDDSESLYDSDDDYDSVSDETAAATLFQDSSSGPLSQTQQTTSSVNSSIGNSGSKL